MFADIIKWTDVEVVVLYIVTMVHIRTSSLCFGVENIILTLVQLLALLCELFIKAQTWIILRHIFHCHISIHSANTVNKVDAVLITFTYTLQNILQFTAPIKQIFPEMVYHTK